MADMEIKVNVKSLNRNTVLARDVTTDNGFILVTKDTMLNDRIIEKLIEMGINSVYVKIVDYITDTGRERPRQIERGDYMRNLRSNFHQFESIHREKVADVHESLKAIGGGGSIEMDELFNITDGIMDQMQLKTDVLAYLSFFKTNDNITFTHCLNVSMLCNLFGRWLGFQYDELVGLTVAGMLHDIGKMRISQNILNKPGKLTPAEFDIVKNHTIHGYEMVKDLNIEEDIKKAVLFHHERLNGSGYPFGILGDEMGDFSKIIAICDVYDAMTANRTFRTRICPFKVIRDFETKRYDEFDTYFLLTFLKNIAYAYVSSNVLLSSGQRGEIVFINASQLSRPMVLVDDQFVDLTKNKNLEIVEII